MELARATTPGRGHVRLLNVCVFYVEVDVHRFFSTKP